MGTCWATNCWATDSWATGSWADGGTPVVPTYKDGLYFMIPMGGGVIYLKQL